jgi:hypothetical protein
MKGYLERLVRTAANPAESVRPWTASVFAVRYQGDFHVDPSGESGPSTAGMQAYEANSDSAQACQTSASKQTSLPHLERNSLISRSPSTEIALGAAGARQSAYRGPSPTKSIIPESFIANAAKSRPDDAKATEPELARAKTWQSDLGHRGYDTLLSKPGRPKMELAVNPLPPSAGKKDTPAVRNSAAVDRQADEIHIHIGRIEVTAVRPPAPRAPTTREKEVSLDAYLKRRGGRPG